MNIVEKYELLELKKRDEIETKKVNFEVFLEMQNIKNQGVVNIINFSSLSTPTLQVIDKQTIICKKIKTGRKRDENFLKNNLLQKNVGG